MRQARHLLPTIKAGASEKGKSLSLARGWACSLATGGQRAAKALTNILIEGIGGKERHLHCVPRCPQGLPLDTTGVRMRRKKKGSSGRGWGKKATHTHSTGSATAPRLTDPPATAAAAAAATAAAVSVKGAEKSPAQSLSGIWATSALPDQNLSRTCLAKICPTKSPPPPDSANN